MSKSNTYDRYLRDTYAGKELLKKHGLFTQGTWQIYGEDPNADIGGHHSEPLLGTLTGFLGDVVAHAVTMDHFWTWGDGGRIEKIDPKSVTPNMHIAPSTNPSAKEEEDPLVVTVWKYPLKRESGPQNVTIPRKSKIIRFAMQDGTPTFWALLDPANSKEVRTFMIVGTGFDVPADCTYIGSLEDIAVGQSYIWHLFEVPKK